MKILIAGPGTGKTTGIKKLIAENFASAKKIQVVSFTNATVNDLKDSFDDNIAVKCSTLHGFALGLNHLPELYILENKYEIKTIEQYADKLNLSFAQLCEIIKCVTFDNMISSCISFIKANPAYVKDKLGKLDLLLVDEFQDFNPNEQELIMLIAREAGETIILGDDDQSIYGFKDADPDGIISLYKDDNIEKISHANICYRCPDAVVDACSKLLKENKNRIEKDWKKSGKAGNIHFQQFLNQIQCDDYILNAVRKIDLNKESVLILSPLGFIVQNLCEEFTENQIEINNCWVNSIDIDTLSKVWWLRAIYGSHKIPFILFLLKYYRKNTRPRLLRILTEYVTNGSSESDLIQKLVKLDYLPSELTPLIITPIPLEDFFDANTEFKIFKEYIDLEDLEKSLISLCSKIKNKNEFQKDKINLMSIHKSKGLQADHVFVTGLVSGIIPNETIGVNTIEAQRRLLFVGMSRTLKELHMTSTVEWTGRDLRSNMADLTQFKFVPQRRIYMGKNSKFVEEIQSRKYF